MRLKTALACAAAACLTGAATNAAPAAAFAPIPTNLPGVFEIPAPPADFDYIHATDAQLAAYAVPPRPNPDRDRKSYAAWKRAMLMHPTRVTGPVRIIPGSAGHASGISSRINKKLDGTIEKAATSPNWSGEIDYLPNVHSFDSKASFTSVNANLYAPAANWVANNCGNHEDVLTWVGIDGWYAVNALVQAGAGTSVYCSPKPSVTFTWAEFLPYGLGYLPLAAAPGDEIYVHVWANSATSGFAYVQNYSSNQAVQVTLSAPTGAQLVGNTAEFITEAEEYFINGKDVVDLLPSYSTLYFPYAGALTGSGAAYNLNSPNEFGVAMTQNNKTVSVPTKTGASSFFTTYQN